MTRFRIESDSMGEVQVPADRLWGAQTQRSLEYFSIGGELMPREMIIAYAILKHSAALVNHAGGRLDQEKKALIVQVCEEIAGGEHQDMFPLHVWMTGSGTQFNMNINEVIANRCSQLAGQPLGSKQPVHPNDDVNMSQSTNDSFPAAMHIAAAMAMTQRLLPALRDLRESLHNKAESWVHIVKIGRTHLQDATPLTLGQEFSGYVGMLDDNLERLQQALGGVYQLALGGTAVGTGINAPPGFDREVAERIAGLTDGQVSIEFFQSFDAAAVNATIRPLVGDNDVTITLKPTSAATSATNPLYTFDVLVTDWETINAAVGEASTTSVTWPITGAITETTT